MRIYLATLINFDDTTENLGAYSTMDLAKQRCQEVYDDMFDDAEVTVVWDTHDRWASGTAPDVESFHVAVFYLDAN